MLNRRAWLSDLFMPSSLVRETTATQHLLYVSFQPVQSLYPASSLTLSLSLHSKPCFRTCTKHGTNMCHLCKVRSQSLILALSIIPFKSDRATHLILSIDSLIANTQRSKLSHILVLLISFKSSTLDLCLCELWIVRERLFD